MPQCPGEIQLPKLLKPELVFTCTKNNQDTKTKNHKQGTSLHVKALQVHLVLDSAFLIGKLIAGMEGLTHAVRDIALWYSLPRSRVGTIRTKGLNLQPV